MPSVEVVIPWLAGCPHRTRALQWVSERHTWPIRLAAGSEPWIKARAVMPAIEASSAAVLVVADADCFTDGLGAAVAAVEAGAPWAIPHKGVHRLTEQGTAAMLAGEPWEEQPLAQPAYRGVEGGGFVVARRETLLEVPLDPRFIGWGNEDESHGVALRTMAGPPWRAKAPLVHLYHPPQQRATRRWGSVQSRQLYRRYLAALDKPDRMRPLLQEVRDALSADKQAVHAA